MARTVRELTPAPLPAAIQAGAALPLRPDPRMADLQIIGPDGAQMAMAADPTFGSLTQPSFYQIEGPGFSRQIGVNAGSVVESDLRQPDSAPPQSQPEFRAPAQANDDPQRRARDIWPWLALGALALLMLEWGYIHR